MTVDLTHFVGDPKLAHLLATRGLLIAGRFSGASGSKAYKMAALDLYGAAEALKSKTGIDVVGYLPPIADLVGLLQMAPALKSHEANGNVFFNRFVVLELAPGVTALLSAGTGLKLDDDAAQPFVSRLAALVKELNPALTMGKRWSRMGRSAWGLGPLMTRIQSQGGYIGDGKGGIIQPKNGLDSLMVFFAATTGEVEASELPAKTRNGMNSRSGRKMIKGQVAYSVGNSPPPGFAQIRMRNAAGGIGDPILTLDGPRWYPKPDDVVAGLPSLLGADDKQVCQVENVRWALRHIGLPGWKLSDVATSLAARGFSTDGVRKRHGPAATAHLDGGTSASGRLHSLLTHLDVYESGILAVTLGVEGVENFKIEGCTPEGGWAEPEDFARIRRFQQDQAERESNRITLNLATTKATVQGEPARLLALSEDRRDGDFIGYLVRRFSPRSTSPQPGRVPDPVVPHECLALSIQEGLAAAGEVPLILLPDKADVDPQETLTLRQMEVEKLDLEARKAALYTRVTAMKPDGTLTLSGQMLEDLNREYNRVSSEEIPAKVLEIAKQHQRMLDGQRRLSQGKSSLYSNQLLQLLASLRDPFDLTCAKLWRDSIHNLAFTVERSREHSRHVTQIRWTGSIQFEDSGQLYAVEFSGEYREGTGTKIPTRVASAVDQMRQGVPLVNIAIPCVNDLRRSIAEEFGQDGKTFMLGSCLDPRIVRCATALLLQPDRGDKDLALELGETPMFIARLRRIYIVDPPIRAAWLIFKSQAEATCNEVASRNEGRLVPADYEGPSDTWPKVQTLLRRSRYSNEWTLLGRGQGLQLKPCPNCGGFRRAPMRIPEPDGLLCLDCRCDTSGLMWPASPYDSWICMPQVWGLPREEGNEASVPTPPTATSGVSELLDT